MLHNISTGLKAVTYRTELNLNKGTTAKTCTTPVLILRGVMRCRFIMKREYYIRKKCTEEGCNEEGIYSYSTQREYHEALKKNRTYTCNRHTRPNEVLSNDNLKTEVELKCVGKSYSTERCNFWQRAEHFGTDKLDSGFQHGNGYKAWAKDFPEGTILKVTAEIILPDA